MAGHGGQELDPEHRNSVLLGGGGGGGMAHGRLSLCYLLLNAQ